MAFFYLQRFFYHRRYFFLFSFRRSSKSLIRLILTLELVLGPLLEPLLRARVRVGLAVKHVIHATTGNLAVLKVPVRMVVGIGDGVW